MTEQQKQLRADVPAEAAQILDQFLAGMRMDGLTGQQAAVLLAAMGTVRKALVPEQKA